MARKDTVSPITDTHQPSPEEAAHAYAALGWRVLPIKPKEKRPPMASWQHAATTDTKAITNWFRGLYREHGVGIATGRESGIWVLDIDTHDADGLATLDELQHVHGTLPETVTAITGSNGRHLFFTYPPIPVGWKVGTTKNIGAGIDVRGDGGQVVAAPTVHPNGTPYTWAPGLSPWHVLVAPAPTWLLELVTVQPAPPAPAPTGITIASPMTDTNPDSIAEWVNRAHSWHDVLHGDGWSIDSVRGEDTYWTRPGKQGGVSAVLHGDGPLVVFSTSVPALQRADARGDGDTWAYSLFGYLAATRHDGNRSAAASAYRTTLQQHATSTARAITSSSTSAALAALDDGGEDHDDEWTPLDLGDIAAAIRNGTHQPIMPEVLEVDGAFPLFYCSRVNSLFGESGGGKTWVALAAIAEVVRSGHRAAMIDYEDAPAGIAERLVLLGLDDDEVRRVDYVNPTTGIGIGIEQFEGRGNTYTLVVIDSTGEAMAAGGVDANADREVAQWFTIVKRICRLPGGPAVVVLDHVPKDKDAPSAYAIGSQRKRAAVTGAAYRVDTLKEPAKGRDGKLKLSVAKDRPGNRAKGTTAAIIDLHSTAAGVELVVHLEEHQGEAFRPTVLMERVSRHLERLVDGASQRSICRDVTGKTDGIRVALGCLVEDGFATFDTASKTYRSVREYRENDVQNVKRAPAPQARPTAPQGAFQTSAPRAPVTQYGGAGRGLKAQLDELHPEERAPDPQGHTAPLPDDIPTDDEGLF